MRGGRDVRAGWHPTRGSGWDSAVRFQEGAERLDETASALPPPKKKRGGERRRADGATSGGCGVRVGQRPPASKGKQGVRTGRHRLPGESGWDDTWGRNTRAGRCPARRAGRESETVPESGTREQHAPPPKKTAKHASAPAPQKGVASAHESAMSKGYTRTATRQPRRSRQRSCRTPCTFPQKAP